MLPSVNPRSCPRASRVIRECADVPTECSLRFGVAAHQLAPHRSLGCVVAAASGGCGESAAAGFDRGTVAVPDVDVVVLPRDSHDWGSNL